MVLVLAQRPAAAGEELGVDREKHALVVGEGAVEVEDERRNRVHRLGTLLSRLTSTRRLPLAGGGADISIDGDIHRTPHRLDNTAAVSD